MNLTQSKCQKFMGDTKDEQEKLEICIKEVLAGFKKADFEYLSFSKKREFLASNIESMKFDKKTKEVEITFRVSENVENKSTE